MTEQLAVQYLTATKQKFREPEGDGPEDEDVTAACNWSLTAKKFINT